MLHQDEKKVSIKNYYYNIDENNFTYNFIFSFLFDLNFPVPYLTPTSLYIWEIKYLRVVSYNTRIPSFYITIQTSCMLLIKASCHFTRHKCKHSTPPSDTRYHVPKAKSHCIPNILRHTCIESPTRISLLFPSIGVKKCLQRYYWVYDFKTTTTITLRALEILYRGFI